VSVGQSKKKRGDDQKKRGDDQKKKNFFFDVLESPNSGELFTVSYKILLLTPLNVEKSNEYLKRPYFNT